MQKECTQCHILKSNNDFFKSSKNKDGYKSECKICHSKTAHNCRKKEGYYQKQYLKKRQNPNEYFHGIYQHMKDRVSGKTLIKTTAEGQSIIDIKSFRKWTFETTNFLELFNDFVRHGFQRKMAPSIDRIDIKKGYIIGNIQWLTLTDNQTKRFLVDYKKN